MGAKHKTAIIILHLTEAVKYKHSFLFKDVCFWCHDALYVYMLLSANCHPKHPYCHSVCNLNRNTSRRSSSFCFRSWMKTRAGIWARTSRCLAVRRQIIFTKTLRRATWCMVISQCLFPCFHTRLYIFVFTPFFHFSCKWTHVREPSWTGDVCRGQSCLVHLWVGFRDGHPWCLFRGQHLCEAEHNTRHCQCVSSHHWCSHHAATHSWLVRTHTHTHNTYEHSVLQFKDHISFSHTHCQTSSTLFETDSLQICQDKLSVSVFRVTCPLLAPQLTSGNISCYNANKKRQKYLYLFCLKCPEMFRGGLPSPVKGKFQNNCCWSCLFGNLDNFMRLLFSSVLQLDI